MTSTSGTYTDCGDDNFALSFTCVGPSCSGLQGFPLNVACTNLSSTSIQCSNGVTCQGPSNFTSVFSFYQNDLTTSQSQIITTGGKSYKLTSQGTPNSTTITPSTDLSTNSGSTSHSSPRSRPNLLLLIIMLCLMVTQVSAISFQNIVDEFEGPIATYLEGHLDGEPYAVNTFLQDIVGSVCQAAVGDLLLGGATANCMAVLGLISITNPAALFAYVVLGTMLCDEIINGLLNGIPGKIESGLCNALESAVGLTEPPTSSSSTSSSPSTPTSASPSSVCGICASALIGYPTSGVCVSVLSAGGIAPSCLIGGLPTGGVCPAGLTLCQAS